MRVSSRRGARLIPALAAAFAAAALVVLLAAVAARAAELVYWDNANDGTLGVSNLDGTGGAPLNTAGVEIETPGGMSYDPVTDRLYVASRDSTGGGGLIAYVNRDGSGGGAFQVPVTAPLVNPEGVVVDPVMRIAYWLNTGAVPESISWARLDSSEGGKVEIGTTPLAGAQRLALDPAAGRLYWGNDDGSIEFAAVNGTGGGSFAAKTIQVISGISYYPAAERLYWVEENENKVSSATPTETAATLVPNGSAPIATPWGLAFDPGPANPRLYWANEADTTPAGAIGFTGVPGSESGGITPTGAPVNGPQDPVIIKSPTNTVAPTVAAMGRQLSCSQGSWAADAVSSFVYQAPRTFAYQWTLNDVPIAAATESSYMAGASGRYKCVVTATNAAGSASRTSDGVKVTVTVATRPGKSTPRQTSTPARLQLIGKARHLRARPGTLLTLRVQVANQGAVASKPAKLCLKLTKKAKRALRAGKCQQLGALAGGATASARLRLRVRRSAGRGLYKLKIALPGSETKVTVRVLG